MKTNDNRLNITGRTIGRFRPVPISSAKVEAWDKDLISNDVVGSAITDKHGSFEIVIDPLKFQDLFFDRKPDLFFKATDETSSSKAQRIPCCGMRKWRKHR
jgi:hypothetical protein